MKIVIIPPADLRERVREASAKDLADEAHRAGTLRGGYGNPFPLGAEEVVSITVAEALADQLRALGHDVRLEAAAGPQPGQPALDDAALAESASRYGVDLVVHGELEEWVVDLGVYGTHKTKGRLALVAAGPGTHGSAWRTTLAVDDQDGNFSFGFTRGLTDLSDLADAWYGAKSPKYVNTAAYEGGLIQLCAELVEPRSDGYILFVDGGTPAATVPVAGCSSDAECKGDRICRDRACFDP